MKFSESWREYFSGVGLASFGDFYGYAGGTKIGSNERRNVYRLTFGEGDEAKVFFIKRFSHSHLKDIIAAWRNLGRPVSQAEVEWSNANLLLENAIDTYKPVCMGERMMCGIERQSFVLTEELESNCLLDFVIEKWHFLQREIQEKIIVAMGQLARKAHEANICLQDLYIWHVYIYEDSLGGDVRLSVIDLHRMLRNIENPRKKISDVGALYWSMSSEYFDEGHKDLLVETYAAGGSGDKSAILRDIEKRAAVLDRRRILKNHYERARRGLGLD